MIFKNIILIPSGIALKSFSLVRNSVFDNVPKKHFYLYALYKRFTLNKKRIEVSSPYIIHNHWSAGYHHWLTEALVRLLNVENYKEKTLIIPENYPSFAFESLSLLEVNNIIKISPEYVYFFKTLEIPPNPHSGFYNKDELQRIKMKLMTPLSIPTNNPKKNIYITRKTATKRKIENEEALISVLKKYDFDIIDTAKLSLYQQIEVFSQCRILMSIHGAGLTNVLFMPEKSYLIEFYKANTFINRCYERLCSVLNINFQRIFCQGGKNKATHVDKTDLIVNIADIEEYLSRII